MQALKENQAQRRCAESQEFEYPAGRRTRRLRPAGEPTQSEPSMKGGSASDVQRHSIAKRGRFWNVIDPRGALVCVTVYKRGALEVSRRLDATQVDLSAPSL